MTRASIPLLSVALRNRSGYTSLRGAGCASGNEGSEMLTSWREESGATAAEYAILVSLIAVAIIGAVTLLGRTVQGSYDCSAQNVESLRGDEPGADC